MILGGLVIGDPAWWAPAGLILAATVLVVWWAYRGVSIPDSPGVRIAAALLKAVGLALLAVCLVNPLWSGTRARPHANLFLLLADNSQSLTIQDAGADHNRTTALKDVLTGKNAGWQSRLAQDFEVRRYQFDSRLQTADDFSKLTFDGDSTALQTALNTLRDRFHERPVAGVLLFTDGNATGALVSGPSDTAADATTQEGINADGLPPVYPVLLGGRAPVRDVAIEAVSVRQTSFEDAPVTLRAEVSVHGYPNATILAQVHDESGAVVAEETQSVDGDDNPLTFRFQLRPTKPGVSFYHLHVAAESEDPTLRVAEVPTRSQGTPVTEATTANNTRLVAVDRGAGPFRILYVSGRPNWEFKFLNRAAEEDPQLDLAALIRIAKREAKFDFRGRVGESSNPLFRGFDKVGDEDTERYDEPVFVRLNMKDADELRGGFPKTAEDLYAFHAVILDDVEAEFFTHDQMTLLESFVSARGGGLLMLGGQESYRAGGYQETPIAGMLPVYLDHPAESRPGARYRWSLTREGWLQPWVRLRTTQTGERQRLDEMPGFHTMNRVGAVKPGAVVLATAGNEPGNELPALAVQRFGRGRAAAVTIGDLWRWQLQPPVSSTSSPTQADRLRSVPSASHRLGETGRDEDAEQHDPGKAWRQMLRWLVADVPQQMEVTVKSAPDVTAEAVRLRAHVRDAQYKPLDNAAVTFNVHPPDGKPIPLDAEPSSKEVGVYEVVYVPRDPGAYRVRVNAADAEGNEIGSGEAGWTSDPAAAEYRSITPNRRLMQQLAERTGGEIVALDDLDDFVASLPNRAVPITEAWTFPLWHQAWVFLMAVGCFVAEWGLRRWKGLP